MPKLTTLETNVHVKRQRVELGGGALSAIPSLGPALVDAVYREVSVAASSTIPVPMQALSTLRTRLIGSRPNTTQG